MWIIVTFLLAFFNFDSDGSYSLQRIYEWATDVMLHFPDLVRWRNRFEWPEGEYIFSKSSFLGELFL